MPSSEVLTLQVVNRDLRDKANELNQKLKEAGKKVDACNKAQRAAEKQQEAALAAQATAEAETQNQRNRAAAKVAEYQTKLDHLTTESDVWTRNERTKRRDVLDQEDANRRKVATEYANARRAEADAEAERLRRESTAAVESAQSRAAKLEAEAHDAIAQRHEAAIIAQRDRQQAADVVLHQTQADTAKQKRDAQLAAERIEREAQALLDQAKLDVEAGSERRTAELDARAATLHGQKLTQNEQEASLGRRARSLQSHTEQLESLESDLQAEQTRLDAARAAFSKQEASLGPAAVETLEGQVHALKARLEQARADRRVAAEQAEQLEARLDAAAGEGASQKFAELEALREHSRALERQLENRLTPETGEQLQQAAAESTQLREALSTQRQRVQELTSTQDQHDQSLQAARRDADMKSQHLRQLESEHAKERDRFEAQLEVLRETHDGLLTQQQQFELAQREQHSQQVLLDAERVHNDALTRKLSQYTEQAKAASESQFGALARMDANPPTTGLAAPSRAPSLAVLATRIRDHLANGVGHGDTPKRLYYDEHTIRTFLGSLACADLTLLQGPSGTGKTSLPLAIGEALGAEVKRIPVQAGWRDRADLLGYYNAFTKSFRSTPFTEVIYRAGLPDYQDRPVFVLLDECNLSQMEYYFADLLSELEDWSKPASIQLFDETVEGNAPLQLEDGRALPLPRNIRYFGTANQDETTFGIADKTYDRASVLLLESRAKPYSPNSNKRLEPLKPVSWSGLCQRFDTAIAKPGYKPKDIHRFVELLEPVYMEEFGFGLGNRFEERIIGQFLPVYVAAGGDASDGLDHLVRTRIVRRLERLRDPALKQGLELLRDEVLINAWPKLGKTPGRPEQSLKALNRIIDRVGR